MFGLSFPTMKPISLWIMWITWWINPFWLKFVDFIVDNFMVFFLRFLYTKESLLIFLFFLCSLYKKINVNIKLRKISSNNFLFTLLQIWYDTSV